MSRSNAPPPLLCREAALTPNPLEDDELELEELDAEVMLKVAELVTVAPAVVVQVSVKVSVPVAVGVTDCVPLTL